MNDLISRQAATDAVLDSIPNDEYWREQVKRAIFSLPPAQPKKGHWDLHKSGALFICSACGETSLRTERYCPNCGAKMEVTE